uniref:Cupin 2, conserved barrel domain protein n=1 Tax=Solibacter usitatus (strain Ellin6076) TaxID=234267 RepID=Q020C9_SOLUE
MFKNINHFKMTFGAAALAVALTCGIFGSAALLGQTQAPPLQIIGLAQGFSPDNHINIKTKGPTDILQAELVFQPGGDTGWHIHPGPVVVVVKSGSLTEEHRDGCITVHPAGSVFFETEGEVHRAFNQTGVVTDVFATFFSPTGSQPLIPVAAPGETTCRNPSAH